LGRRKLFPPQPPQRGGVKKEKACLFPKKEGVKKKAFNFFPQKKESKEKSLYSPLWGAREEKELIYSHTHTL